jgi:hygromycin-B 7''-O-kinase
LLTVKALLPAVRSKAEYFGLFRDDSVWRPALQVIGERHGFASASLHRAAVGSHVVMLGEREVVKLFAPPWPDDFAAEQPMLEHVAGRLPIATPQIVAEGELEGWPYLVMTRLAGEQLDTLWPKLPLAEQRRLLVRTGELAAALHALPLVEIGTDPATAWRDFVATRKRKLAEKHAADGLSAVWIEDIERTVAALPEIEVDEPVCLHTDMHAGNMLVRSIGDRLELSGLFDFGDAMLGAREHELIAPAAFMAAVVPGGLRALLRGYGVAQPELDTELVHRLTAHLLLQRYCSLPNLLTRLAPPPTELASLLARLWDLRE